MRAQTFEEVLHMHGDYILRLCFTYTKDWQIAEDLTQETFLRFFQAKSNFRHDSEVTTYLYKIAVNRCKTYLASWRYKQIVLLEFGQKLMARDNVETSVIEKEQSAVLYKKIESLPVKYREIIVLYHYVEMTTAQIALILRVSENTVKTRLRRGRQQLGDILEKGGLINESDF